MTDDSAFKKQVRARMAETGEKYTTTRRMVIAGRDPGQPPVALRVHLNPYVDLELTTEAARAAGAAEHGEGIWPAEGAEGNTNRTWANSELKTAAGVRPGEGHARIRPAPRLPPGR